MFDVSMETVARILRDFHVPSKPVGFSELRRYHYERDDPASKEVRLIVRVALESGEAVVIRFKNEAGVSLDLINAQSRFAALLSAHGIATPALFQVDGQYAAWYRLNGYDVIVAVESFEEGEIRFVNEAVAEKTGELLADMHDIAEKADFHVANDVLFNPLAQNDLFDFSEFERHQKPLMTIDAGMYRDIVATYQAHMRVIATLAGEPRYAVQGDISHCNLYLTDKGTLGIFDFNRCGDNNLYFDAVMQSLFEARLMDYPDAYAGRAEETILPAFLQGYHQQRPFSKAQREVFPYLYAVVSAFWLMDMKWSDTSLRQAVEDDDREAMREALHQVHRRIHHLPAMPV
ncbi:MAG: phosphotransferase enzyme family protein [Christensenellales bacterium]|jgi:Ser/Thr protein kinase RdoA (MazF antagonist)